MKAHLQSKVAGVVSLVNKSIVALSSGKTDKSHATELRKQLNMLKLDELNVDVAMAQIELEKELKLLRGAVGENIAGTVFGSTFDEFAADTAPTSDPFGGSSAALAAGAAAASAAGAGGGGDSGAGDFSGHDAARIKELETENEQLLNMVAELEEAASAAATEATNTNDKNNKDEKAEDPAPAAATAAAAAAATGGGGGGIGSTSDEEVAKLKAELASLQKQSSALEQQVIRKDKEIAEQGAEISKMTKAVEGGNDSAAKMVKVMEEELSRTKKEIDSLQQQLTQKESAAAESAAAAAATATKAAQEQQKKSDEEAAAKLKSELGKLRAELTDAFAAEKESVVTEVETRMEAEKEEMMEALAQEVDDVESSKNEEIEGLKARAEQLASNAKRAEDRLVAVKQSSGAIISGMRGASDEVLALKREKEQLKQLTKQQMNEMKQAIKASFGGALMGKMKAMNDDLSFMTVKYNKEFEERKKLHNVIQELKGNIRVYVRCRPPSQRELDEMGEDAVCVSYPDQGEVRVLSEKNNREKTWEFDEVFDFNSKQSDVYTDISALVTSVMDGFNVCIFAYGQTGSGKTHTMAGPTSDRGVNTRALSELFDKCDARAAEFSDTVTLSILEVYNEDIRDLLVDGGFDKLEVRQGENGNYVPGLTECRVSSIDDIFNLFAQAERNRATTATNMNEHSSRSHMMLTINVTSENIRTGTMSRGKLNLVDLAGSERINKSGATGQALKEAQNINKSLSSLADVIAARAQKAAHIPFRNSTLTYLLQDSLSKDSKTLMICCISPSITSSDETYNALNFASRVRTVELGKASKNAAPTKKK
jgi:kinesin family protein C2/C3